MFRGIGLIEILLIAAVILLIFGGRKPKKIRLGSGNKWQ